MAKRKKTSAKETAKALAEEYNGPFKLTVNLKTIYTSENVDQTVSFDSATGSYFSEKPTDNLEYNYTLVEGPTGDEFDKTKWRKWTFIKWNRDPGDEKVIVTPSEIDIPATEAATYTLTVEPGEATASGGETFSVPGGTFTLVNTSTDPHYIECSVEDQGIRYSFVLSTDIPEYKEDMLYIGDVSSDEIQQVMWKINMEDGVITLTPAGGTSYTGDVGLLFVSPVVEINKTVTITAGWRTDVNINFDPVSGEGDPYSWCVSNEGQSISRNVDVPCEFYSDAYIFDGWDNIDGVEGISFVSDTSNTILNINVNKNTEVTLSATWEERPQIKGKTQIIHFHSNFIKEDSQTEEIKHQEVQAGNPVQLITNEFEREKYDFMGWAITPYGEVKFENNAMYDVPNSTDMEWDDDKEDWVVPDLDLYAVWARQKSHIVSEDDICLVGYDPFPVVFRDMSRIRSFKNSYWAYDFGDSIIYGCDTSQTTVANIDSISAYRLPSDRVVCENSNIKFKEGLKIPSVEIGVMIPSSDNDYRVFDYSSYHYTSWDDNLKMSHFTGVRFTAVTPATDNRVEEAGSGCYLSVTKDQVDGDLNRFRYLPNSSQHSYVHVDGIHELMNEDDCGRVMCERENDLKNSVMHIYKGAGIYYSTMQVSSKTGLQSMEVADETYSVGEPGEKEKVVGCFVKVLPTCPCISGFHVYGSSGTDGAAYYERKFEIIKNAYSCDDEMFNVTPSDFNCVIKYKDINGTEKITKAISGYAPFLKVQASGYIEPRSLPVKGAYIDWGDWFSDYQESDYIEYGDPSGGWPNWETSASENGLLKVFGSHVYVMPGLYSVGIAPDYNTAWIKRFMPTVDPADYEDCLDGLMANSASGCCVLVVENPPKFDTEVPIVTGDVPNPEQHPTKVVGMSVNLAAGSYPISRIDWDFGDGTKPLSISTEGYKIDPNTKDVIGNGKQTAVNVNYNTEYSSANPVSLANITYGTMYGHAHHNEQSLSYSRWDARNYSVDHTYVRTSFADHPNGYVITVSAYAENTNTCATASARILTENGAKLPDYNLTEGDIELVDVRSDESETVNVVFQSEKESRLYVNRVVDDD